METALTLQSCSWIGTEKAAGRSRNGGFLKLSSGLTNERRSQTARFTDSRKVGRAIRTAHVEVNFSCSCNYNNGGIKPAGSDNFHSSVDGAKTLKRKAQDILPHLSGRCLYLVGMMGSGKSTVGKILAEVLGYSFFDSDKLVEQAVGVTSVAQIFEKHSEAFFRDNESAVLKELSSMRGLVVATGGGAVIRPVNWTYMKHGLSVWLDVPLEALARRIAAVGTASRPLLHQEPGDPYTKAFAKLTTLSEQRGKAYANADARVCLETIAAKHGHGDVSLLTPSDISFEALLRIEVHLLESSAVRNGQQYIQGRTQMHP